MTEKQNEQGVSRRDFLKGAAVAAVAPGSIVPVVRIAQAAGSRSALVNPITFEGTELLGRPTDHSIMLNVVSATGIEAYVKYGRASGVYTEKTAVTAADAGAPLKVRIDNLSPNSRYYYSLMVREKGGSDDFQDRPEYTFHTQRGQKDAFVFTVISDSHLNWISFNNPDLYTIACQNVRNDNPDLHFDLGDTFTLTWLEPGDFTGVRKAYMAQRPFMGLFAHSTPVLLAIGNHEEEEGWNLDDVGDAVSESKPIMGVNARKRYYPNPIPDGFYTGNSDASQKEIDGDHLKEDYYAFEWGCALFVVLDPFWYTMAKPFIGAVGGENTDDDMPTGDCWRWTLGKDQYDWLKQTLEKSNATYKFVMAHQVAGGGDNGNKGGAGAGQDGMPDGTDGNDAATAGIGGADYGRGGETATHGYEWGADPEGFAANRPGWSSTKSIHRLFVDNGVDVFFHGHDHVYAREESDGVIYQECPFPANSEYGLGFNYYSDNTPKTIVKRNSGHIRVTVTPEKATVDYVRAFLPDDGENGYVEYSYSITKDDKPVGA